MVYISILYAVIPAPFELGAVQAIVRSPEEPSIEVLTADIVPGTEAARMVIEVLYCPHPHLFLALTLNL